MAKELKDVTIRNIKPSNKDQRLYDGDGLYLLVKSNGYKWWRFDYTFDKKRKTLSIGVYPDVSLGLARDKRHECRQLIAQGIDPSKQRKMEQAANSEQQALDQCIELGIAIPGSFEAVARDWLDQKYRKETTAVTLQKTTRQLELHAFRVIGATPIQSLKSSDILAMLKPLANANKVETVHRVRTLCNSIFNYAIVHNIVEYNPVIALQGALPAIQVTHRAAITEPVRVGQLLRDLYSYTGTFVVTRALRLSALLMVRPGELRQAEWKDFYLEDAEWRYYVTKTGTEHNVPLSKQALEILTELQLITGKERYVLPSSRNDGRPMSENTIRQALRTMGYANEDMSAHGFRTTASTLLNEQGWSPDAIERQLAHSPKDKVRAAYNRAQYLDERKRMMQAWADYLDKLRLGAEVLPFEKPA